MTSWLAAQDDPAEASAAIRRFGALTRSTPALRAHQHDMTDQLVVTEAAQASWPPARAPARTPRNPRSRQPPCSASGASSSRA